MSAGITVSDKARIRVDSASGHAPVGNLVSAVGDAVPSNGDME